MKIFAWILVAIEWCLTLMVLGVFVAGMAIFVWFPTFVVRRIDAAFAWAHRVTYAPPKRK